MRNTPLGLGAQLAVAALIVLGMLGGSLVVSHSGFGTSPKHGGPSTFVPAPQAYLLAVLMYAMSAVGLLALLRNRRTPWPVIALAAALYTTLAMLMVVVL